MATDRNDRENRPQRYDRDERDVGDRAGDEVRSWFGDDDAQRCRRMDELERDRYGDRDRYVDYGEMFRTGAGWAGGRAGGGRYGGDFGGRYGTEVGNRYGGEVRGRYRSGYGLDDDRFDDPYERRYASDRWGASDWQEQDARSRGRHAGRGPADYRRSAERILEDANEALTWHGEVDASQIKVKVEGDEVILEGTVDSRRAKRAAEDAVEDVRGVRDVHNRLRVQAQGEGGAVTTGSGTT